MNDLDSKSSQDSPQPAVPADNGFSPWQRLKTKRISYLTLPLLIMATITEFVILSTGWKYQQVVCLPQGMGVTFFGIGPIGATILAVELLKLPLAIWTASRHGWQKVMMISVGLPCICLLTFQLVKDMAVYEMGVAMNPATQMLEKAAAEDTKIADLNNQLAAIEQKKADREHKIADITAKEAQAKSDLEASLKRNEDIRHDAVSLTDYQRKELSEVDNRESSIIMQFNADTAQINKALADLRATREVEVERNTKWNAEQARIDNEFNAKMTDYSNAKAAYDKAKANYENANFLKRKLMKEPVSPGVAPEREVNKILKPTAVAEIDAQITAKEAELTAVNNKRRDRIAQVEADARALRAQFDSRSVTRRDEADKKRDELAQAEVALGAEWKAERKQIDQDLAESVKKVDGIRAELAIHQKNAEGFYTAREEAIRKTQVHRIATTVEIIRGLIKGERPMSIKMTAKQRGDILTDQISMVRIWVYPVLAFIVAFLPTLMVEIGFSTVFQPEKGRAQHRFGLFGRELHWVCVRAGRQKILQAERMTKEAQAQVVNRDRALAAAKLSSEQALAEKTIELQAAREAADAAETKHEEELKAIKAGHEEQLKKIEAENAEEAKNKEEQWTAKLATMSETLSRTSVEKDALRDSQKAEVERLVQARQKIWSDRMQQLSQELADHRASSETERAAMVEEHQKKLATISDDARNQISQLRRQVLETESAASEKTTRLTQELQEAIRTRDAAVSELQEKESSLSFRLTQTQENAARESEKAARNEKLFLERQQMEFERKMRQREDTLEHQFKQREQELTLAFDARLDEEKAKIEADARVREAERARQLAARTQEADAYRNEEIKNLEDAAQAKLKQREQQLQTQADARVKEAQAKAAEELRQRQLEFERQADAQSHVAEARTAELLKQREQQWELQTQARLKEAQSQADARLKEVQFRADARVKEAQAQLDAQLQEHQAEFERQRETKSRDTEVWYRDELQQKETQFQTRLKEREREWALKADARTAEVLKQREQQWQAQADARLKDAQADADALLQDRQAEFERQLATQSRGTETRLRDELQKRESQFQSRLREREQELNAKTEARIAEIQRQSALEVTARQEDLERRAEERVTAAESRLGEEAKHREDLFQARLRQRDQQWQSKLDAALGEVQGQTEEAVRRRGAEGDAALRALEAKLLEEMQQREMAFQTNAMQHEQEAIAQVRTLWEAESDAKIYAAMESFRGMLDRAEKERDEARQSALEGIRRVETLEKKLTEASSFFNSWRSGNGVTEKV